MIPFLRELRSPEKRKSNSQIQHLFLVELFVVVVAWKCLVHSIVQLGATRLVVARVVA